MTLPPDPETLDSNRLTVPQIKGPYFKAGSPERASLLEPGLVGTRLIVSGYVLTPEGRPVANTLLDFWQADSRGEYDNAGYRLRGHQRTDETGFYQLETIVPGLYPGRTRHLHVKVQTPGQPVLTTQLYFPGEPRNETDSIFHPSLVLPLRDTPDGKTARFDFVRLA